MIRPVPGLALTIAIAAGVMAEDGTADLRLRSTLLTAPEVSERTSDAAGNQQTLDWDLGGMYDRRGIRGELLWGHSLGNDGLPRRLHLILGGSAGYSDITPKRYEVRGGTTVSNQRQDLSLGYNQVGGTVGLGWYSQPTSTGIGWLHYEVEPLLRVGEGWAQTISAGADPSSSTARGYWYEGALVMALVVVNDGILFDLHAGVDVGAFRATTAFSDGSRSELVIGGVRPEIGLAVGGSF